MSCWGTRRDLPNSLKKKYFPKARKEGVSCRDTRCHPRIRKIEIEEEIYLSLARSERHEKDSETKEPGTTPHCPSGTGLIA